jgi:hypothetical protein
VGEKETGEKLLVGDPHIMTYTLLSHLISLNDTTK